MSNLCIECKERPARYWNSSFCEECFRILLQEKLNEDSKKESICQFKIEEDADKRAK